MANEFAKKMKKLVTLLLIRKLDVEGKETMLVKFDVVEKVVKGNKTLTTVVVRKLNEDGASIHSRKQDKAIDEFVKQLP